jgi:hypothetical protein
MTEVERVLMLMDVGPSLFTWSYYAVLYALGLRDEGDDRCDTDHYAKDGKHCPQLTLLDSLMPQPSVSEAFIV